jgi:hypothetical protein
MTITDLVSRFVWVRDKIDSFRILSSETGPLRGDCDDFAITALWIVEGKSTLKLFEALLNGRAAIWRTYTKRGTRHAVLWHRDYGFIDNIAPDWAENTPHTLRHKRWTVTVAIKMLIGLFVR